MTYTITYLRSCDPGRVTLFVMDENHKISYEEYLK